MEFLGKQALLEKRAAEKYTLRADAFQGDSFDSMSSGKFPTGDPERRMEGSKSITMASTVWDGSEGHAKLWDKIEMTQKELKKKVERSGRVTMAAQLPDDIATLTDLMRFDVSRRIMQQGDYTGIVGTEIVNPGMNKTNRLDEFIPYGAAFTKIAGSNDALKLMEHKSGDTETFDIDLFAVGDKSSLAEEIFSTIYSLQRVTDAVARGYVAQRNDLTVLGRAVAKTTATAFAASNKVAADATAGATKEELLFNTLVTALKTLYLLKDPQTKKIIQTPSVILAIPKGTEFAFARAMNGLSNGGKVGVFNPLTQIAAVIPYEGDTIYMGKETFSYPGVAAGFAYMFVPKVANYTFVKRGITTETGVGSVLDLSRTERAWWFAQGKYDKEFFGASESGGTAGEGFCLEITLPTL